MFDTALYRKTFLWVINMKKVSILKSSWFFFQMFRKIEKKMSFCTAVSYISSYKKRLVLFHKGSQKQICWACDFILWHIQCCSVNSFLQSYAYTSKNNVIFFIPFPYLIFYSEKYSSCIYVNIEISFLLYKNQKNVQ